MSLDLSRLVLNKITELGVPQAAEFFGVPPTWIQCWVSGATPIPIGAAEKVFSPQSFSGKMEEANWEGKKVAILLPFHKQTNPLTLFSLLTIIDRAKMRVMMQFGDAFIVHTRNQLVAQFMRSTAELSWWVDDDMIPPCGMAEWYNNVTEFNLPEKFAGMHTLNRLLESGKTLVGGLYFGRNSSRKPMYGGASVNTQEMKFAHAAPHDLVKRVPWVATGCLLVHRSVYESIQQGFPELAPQTPNDTWHHFSQSETELTRAVGQALQILNDGGASDKARLEEVKKVLRIAQKEVDSTKRLRFGEDVTFCKRAEKVGHPPHVDFGVVCGHVGSYVYGPKGASHA